MWSPNAFTSSSSSSSSLEDSTDDEGELDYNKNLTIQSVIILCFLLIIGKFGKKIHSRRNKKWLSLSGWIGVNSLHGILT